MCSHMTCSQYRSVTTDMVLADALYPVKISQSAPLLLITCLSYMCALHLMSYIMVCIIHCGG